MLKQYWDLERLLPIKEFHAKVATTEALLLKIAKEISLLTPAVQGKDFSSLISELEAITNLLMILYARTMLWEDTDLKSSDAKYFKGQAKDLLIKFEDITRPFWLWIKGKHELGGQLLDAKNAERLFAATPGLTYLFHRERELARHSLDNASESIIANKDQNGVSTLLDLRALIEAGTSFTFKAKGKTIKANTTAELVRYVYDQDPETRKNAYTALLSHYKKEETKYFTIYEAVVKDWNYETKLRNFDSAVSMRNVKNDVSDAAINSLLETCKNNASLFQRLFKLKAKLLGVEKISRFDLYAPLKSEGEAEKYSYKQSVDLLYSVLEPFDGDFFKHAKTIIDGGYVDVKPDKNKRGGAYCLTVSNKFPPYLLLNHTGTKKDVMVLAHETGHGIHAILASKNSILNMDAPLTLAETASTFLETLMFEKLFEKEQNIDKKIAMLLERVTDAYASIMRQNFFVLFELVAHQEISKGIKLPDLRKKYLENLKQQFGEAIEIDPIFQYEWLYIPHIVNSPFYCYAYSFGELLALALYQEYKVKGKPFIITIKDILKAGGSVNAAELLYAHGIDIAHPEFWQLSFDLIKTQIEELEELTRDLKV